MKNPIQKKEIYLEEGEYGTSFTLKEANRIVESHKMEEYHKHIMSWLIYEVERLKEENKELKKDLRQASYEIKYTTTN